LILGAFGLLSLFNVLGVIQALRGTLATRWVKTGDIPLTIVATLLALTWRRLGGSAINRQFRSVFLAALCGYLGVRGCVWLMGLPIDRLPPLALVAFSTPLIATRLPIPGFRYVGVLGICLALASSFTPGREVLFNIAFAQSLVSLAAFSVWRGGPSLPGTE